MLRSARQSFIESPVRAEFENIALTKAFEAGCQSALLVFIEEQTTDENPNNACARDNQRVGAVRALEILRELHLKQEPPTPLQMPQLKPPK
jgi:hypothetical protein